MIKQTAAAVIALSLALTAGCNRNAATNNVAAAGNAAAPAAANASAPAGNVAAPAGNAQVRLGLTATGLEAIEPGGRTSPLAFGSPIALALDGLTRMFGAPSSDATNAECGAGPVRIIQWSNGLSVLAQNDQMQGWQIERPGVSVLGDLQVGAARAAVQAKQATFEQSSLGAEFSIGSGEETVGGLMTDDTPGGTVSTMWAGLTCQFR